MVALCRRDTTGADERIAFLSCRGGGLDDDGKLSISTAGSAGYGQRRGRFAAGRLCLVRQESGGAARRRGGRAAARGRTAGRAASGAGRAGGEPSDGEHSQNGPDYSLTHGELLDFCQFIVLDWQPG